MCGVMFSQRNATQLKKDNRKVSSSCVYVCVCVCVYCERRENRFVLCYTSVFEGCVLYLFLEHDPAKTVNTLCVCEFDYVCVCVGARIKEIS